MAMIYMKTVPLNEDYYGMLQQLAEVNDTTDSRMLKNLVEQAIDERMHNYVDDNLTEPDYTNI